MKKLLLTILSVVSTSVFAAENLVLEHEVPVVLTGEGLEYKNIVYPAGAYQKPGIGSLTLDGATVEANSVSYSQNNWQDGLLALCNGATLSLASDSYFAANSYGNAHGLITLEGDSTLTFGALLTIGCGGHYANTGSAEIRAQDSTLALSSDLAGMGKFTWKLTNCVVSSTAASWRNIKIGSVGGTYAYDNDNAVGITNRVEFVDTNFAYGGQFQLAIKLPGSMLLSGGTFTLGNSWLVAGWGTNAETIGIPDLEASVELTDGAVATVSGGQVSVGAQVGTHGAMSLSDGSSLTALKVYVGEYGEGVLTVDATSAVKATTELKIAVNAESESSVTLNGGTLEVKSVIGGSGTSSFVSNGGTVRMLADGKIFDSVGTVTVGVEGLTVDTQGHAVTLNQSLPGGKVVFIGGGSVTFAEGVTVDDFDAEGGTKLIWADEAETTVVEKTDAGTETRHADVLVGGKDKIAFNVSEGAALTMAGKVGIGSMEKLGGGLLALDNPADKFFGGLTLTAGTLAFGSNAPASMTSGLKLGNAANTLTVIKADADITLAFPDAPVSGAFLKRGTGELVLAHNVTDWGSSLYRPSAPMVNNANFSETEPLDFSDPSVLPTNNYTTLNVVEGKMTIRGPASRQSILRWQGTAAVGVPMKTCAAQPELVLENVQFIQEYQNYFRVGTANVAGSSEIVSPRLTLINSILELHTLYVNHCKVANEDLCSHIYFTNSTLKAYCIEPNGGYNCRTGAFSEFDFIDSCVKIDNFTLLDSFRMTFDHSVLTNTSNSSFVFRAFATTTNLMVFTRGSKYFFNGTSYNLTDYGDLKERNEWVFDDSEWLLDNTESNRTYHVNDRVNVVCVMRGRGLVIKPGLGYTYTIDEPLEGDGGFVNGGLGTVVLNDGMVRYAGVTRAEHSTSVVDFSGATIENAQLAGAGSFKNGTLTRARIVVSVVDGVAAAVPTLDTADNLSLTGGVTVDFGDSVIEKSGGEYPTITVAKYTGSAVPDLSRWRIKKTDALRGGTFVAKDGAVTCTPRGKRGFVLVIR